MESDASMQHIRIIGSFYLNDDDSLTHSTTLECFSSEVLPNILLVENRKDASLMTYSGVLLLDKTTETLDHTGLLRLHTEFSAVQVTRRRDTIYLASLEVSLDPFLRPDTHQQYLEQIAHYFAAFHEMLAITLKGFRMRPLTVDELIDVKF